MFESGLYESNYIIDVNTIEKFKNFLIQTVEIFDDDYNLDTKQLECGFKPIRPDPNQIFEYCGNILVASKMEKEVIIISLIYIERFIFNTGVMINSRNWRRLLFISFVIGSKVNKDYYRYIVLG